MYSFHILQCTLTFTKEKTWSSPCKYISHSQMYPHIYLGEDIVLSILSSIYIYSFHIPQCTLTFTKEKTWSSPCNYTSHSQMYFSDLLGRKHDPSPLNSQFYIHVTIPNVLLAYLGEEKSTRDGWEVNDINERLLRWRKERGYKKGRGVGVLEEDCGGWLWLFGLVMILRDLGNLWRFLGFERRKVSLSGFAYSSWGHTISGWTWARRAREPVEVSWARNLFPSWLGGKSGWSVIRSVQLEL